MHHKAMRGPAKLRPVVRGSHRANIQEFEQPPRANIAGLSQYQVLKPMLLVYFTIKLKRNCLFLGVFPFSCLS